MPTSGNSLTKLHPKCSRFKLSAKDDAREPSLPLSLSMPLLQMLHSCHQAEASVCVCVCVCVCVYGTSSHMPPLCRERGALREREGRGRERGREREREREGGEKERKMILSSPPIHRWSLPHIYIAHCAHTHSYTQKGGVGQRFC